MAPHAEEKGSEIVNGLTFYSGHPAKMADCVGVLIFPNRLLDARIRLPLS